MAANEETPRGVAKFDYSAYPPDTLFYDRREGRERRGDAENPPSAGPSPAPPDLPAAPPERQARKERRRRIDPTTFEKQYTDDEIEFMNAMQQFKVRSGKAFPSHGEVLRVALNLGYRRLIRDDDEAEEPSQRESMPEEIGAV